MSRSVQETDYDALSCRISAIVKGYMPCEVQIQKCGFSKYAEMHLAYANALRSTSRRAYGKIRKTVESALPVINYGTYLRTVSIDAVVSDFLEKKRDSEQLQILNLGCGSDLRAAQFLKRFPQCRVVEVDYSTSVALKIKTLKESPELVELFAVGSSVASQSTELITERYCLLPCDISKMDQVTTMLSVHFSPDAPTLVLTECVLCYMAENHSSQLIKTVQDYFNEGCWLSYDPIGGVEGKDNFGSIMRDNLRESRQLEMPTLMSFNDPAAYAARFASGRVPVQIQTMWQYYRVSVTSEEKQRLKALQFLDEIEELQIMLSHYILMDARWNKVRPA
ncbi:LAMI_0D11980g1_1 [Lachancea mirantina]|uniref:Leucine carboxyl methyltransferase 1 n=1 Tax=Lachancea mirantina TaxID=1230905 RepID=A0A1G4JFD4_9SACH|nr:LAMI_0D11980g1_1 [Lachancea mirantina]